MISAALLLGAMASCDDPDVMVIPVKKGKKIITYNDVPRDVLNASEGNATVKIRRGVYKIKDGAFMGCRITAVSIPNSVREIESRAFASCDYLNAVKLPQYLQRIESGTFDGCRNLSAISIPDGVVSIGEETFKNCLSLTSITLPKSVQEIKDRTFSGCSALSSVTFPNGAGVKVIGEEAFAGCAKLDSIAFPANVIKSRAFMDCRNLSYVSIPPDVQDVAQDAFSGCSNLPAINGIRYAGNIMVSVVDKTRKEYKVKFGTMRIPDYAFKGCKNAKCITLPIRFVEIGVGAFADCSSLESLDLSNFGGEIISKDAFKNCKNLKRITIPNGVYAIRDYAFCGCESLETVRFPESLGIIGEGAFMNCTNLRGHDTYCKRKKIYHGNESWLEEQRWVGVLEIPKHVSKIEVGAFSGCPNLKVLKIPKETKTIFPIVDYYMRGADCEIIYY